MQLFTLPASVAESSLIYLPVLLIGGASLVFLLFCLSCVSSDIFRQPKQHLRPILTLLLCAGATIAALAQNARTGAVSSYQERGKAWMAKGNDDRARQTDLDECLRLNPALKPALEKLIAQIRAEVKPQTVRLRRRGFTFTL